MRHDAFTRDMTHSHVQDSTRQTRSRHVVLRAPPYNCHVTHSHVTWLIHTRLDSFIRDVTHSYVTWLIHMWHEKLTWETDIVLSCSATGWRRPIGCLELQVIFRKRATNDRALLRKITYEDMASYGTSTACRAPCNCDVTHSYVTCLIHMWHNSCWCDRTGRHVSECAAVCWHVLECVVLECVVVCWYVLECAGVCWSVLPCSVPAHVSHQSDNKLQCVGVCWSVLECVAVCWSVLQCVAEFSPCTCLTWIRQ